MSLKQLVIVSILAVSSFAFADSTTSSTTTTTTADKDHARMWTIHAADNHLENSNDSKTVTDPGVFVTAQRDPHDKK